MTSVNQKRVLAILASWVFSGCYFGNRSVGGGTVGTNFYETQPESVQFCAIDAVTGNCKSGSVNQLTSAANLFPNPIEVYQPDPNRVEAIFYTPNTDPNTGIGGNINGTSVDASGSGGANPVFSWADPACTMTLDVQMNGNIYQGALTTGSTFPVTGRLKMQVTTTYSFSPICTTGLTFQTASLCYAGTPAGESCGGISTTDNQSRWQSVDAIFGTWNSLKVIGVADILKLSAIQYIAQYN